jgi:hypothetical protein
VIGEKFWPVSNSPNTNKVAMQIALRLSLFSAIIFASFSAVRGQAVVFVADVEGQWLLNNSQPIRKGQQLPSGGVVTNQSGSPQDSISFANLQGAYVPGLSKTCRVAGECSRPINLPRAKSAGVFGVASALLQGAMAALYGEHNEGIVIPRGRAVSSLPEGVVPLDGEQVDLVSIFRHGDANHYYLGFIPKGEESASKGIGPITFDWNPNKPMSVVVPGIAPGLYELTLMKAVEDRYVRTDDSSWILIADRKSYRAVSVEFQQAMMLTEKWNRNVSSEAKHSFLRASLSYLATKHSKKSDG